MSETGLFDLIDDVGLKSCLDFVAKVDALKKVLRRTFVMNRFRLENSAEHSWHLTLMALVLARYAKEPVQIDRVIKMLILHDLGEIEAGDTFLYDAARADAYANERAAVEKLFAALPDVLRTEFMELWLEMAEGDSPEARFARAMDRFEPFISNLGSGGGTWPDHKLTQAKVLDKNKAIAEGSTTLWSAYLKLAAKAEADGLFYREG